MTRLEQESYDVLAYVLLKLTQKAITPLEYQELVGMVRTVVSHLKNAEYGCPTGIHTASCNCIAAKVGTTKQWVRRNVQ